ncbi:MAG: thioesterase family protein [Bosea sp.]|uniref:thioesterase family protein n=1 Tax=Bosea sp. (in: a-proteobacteria) TaxID=1871050 RepID=UPI001AC5A70B|nr:thioesterase family protein [Bosea sp. (in: a-proteobacteria)]MBN9451300.1 thioesterase family protein [Bosea sp. (in: a-proteobacteria)]
MTEKIGLRTKVKSEWTDYNGHMNVAYYPLVFDGATDALLDALDLGESYAKRSGHGTFAAEAHIIFKSEARDGDELTVESQVIASSDKAIHYFHQMYRGEERELLASYEQLSLHVSHATRKVVAMPEHAQERLRLLAGQAADMPDGLGSVIAVRRKQPPPVSGSRQNDMRDS